MMKTFDVVLPAKLKGELFEHLFPGDGDEHGAAIAAGIVKTARGLRLLARDLFVARDGVDYVPGQRGYRMLTARFVMEKIRYCRDQGLSYLAVHNHGGLNAVGFSGPDFASHERGYPALLQIVRGAPVGALVFATRAAAGDLWLAGGERAELREARVVGASIDRLTPNPRPTPPGADAMYDRQARLFGDRGQELLGNAKVGVIGAGGVGALLVMQLSRLGVGELLVVDPKRVDITNLSRLPGATRFDARTWLTELDRPAWVRAFGRTIAARKVDVMSRVSRRARKGIRFEGIFGSVVDDDVAMRLRDCDYLFLAADSFQARLVFNAVVHQYLIPGVQVGSKVSVEAGTGDIGDVFVVSRPVLPDSGCLWCAGLIPPGRLQEEALDSRERAEQRYVDEVAAPSVITLNAIGAAHAANEFLFSWTGLRKQGYREAYLRYLPRERRASMDNSRREASCTECGRFASSRRAYGDGRKLPTRAAQA